MKWHRVKQAVACMVHTQILQGTSKQANAAALFDAIAEKQLPRESLQSFADRCFAAVMQFDVRRANWLRERFPEYFPKSLRGKELVAEQDSDGHWHINAVAAIRCPDLLTQQAP